MNPLEFGGNGNPDPFAYNWQGYPPVTQDGGGSLGGVAGTGGIITLLHPAIAGPVAQFSYELQYSGIVKFINTSLNAARQFLWDFGDGGHSGAENPYHVYSQAGTYLVRLTVQNGGGTHSTEQSIAVTINPKTLNFSYIVAGFTVQFEFGGNFDSGNILWNFDDGTTSTAKNPRHVFAGNGSYNVTLTAGGLTKTLAVAIAVGLLLAWQDNSSDETGFKIEHATNSTGPWTEIATVGAGITQFGINNGDFGIDTDALNYFRVRAYSGAGNSDYTNVMPVQCSQA